MSDKSKKVVGNKSTEVIIGAAAGKLNGALQSILGAVKEAEKIGTLIEEGTLKVANLEVQVAEVGQDLANKKAQATLELKLAFEGDKQTFVNGYLQEKSLIAVPASELAAQQQKIAEVDAAITREVGKAVGIANSANQSKIRELELTQKATEAENSARIKQQEEQIVFLKSQVEMWKGALDSERNAGVERAKAGAIGSVNVTSSK